jgi:hypothetical protein
MSNMLEPTGADLGARIYAEFGPRALAARQPDGVEELTPAFSAVVTTSGTFNVSFNDAVVRHAIHLIVTETW